MFGAIAVGNIRNYIQTLSPNIKPLVEAELPRILARNEFFVRPDQIMQAGAAQGRGRDAPPVVGAFLEILMSAGYVWDRLTKDNSEADSLGKLLSDLERHITTVSQLLFPDAGSNNSAFSWVHAILWKLRDSPGLANRKAVQDAVLRLCNNYPNPLTLLGEFDTACRSHMSNVLAELKGVSVRIFNFFNLIFLFRIYS